MMPRIYFLNFPRVLTVSFRLTEGYLQVLCVFEYSPNYFTGTTIGAGGIRIRGSNENLLRVPSDLTNDAYHAQYLSS